MPKRNRQRERRRDAARAGVALTSREPADTTGPEPSAEATRPRVPPTAVGHVDDEAGAEALATRLLTPGRAWPVVVISTPAGAEGPYVDTAHVKDEVADLAEVVVLPTGEVSWAFSRTMPEKTQVYGGASRVYGVEHDWVGDPSRSRLHFAWSPQDGERVGRNLVHDALTAALRAGLVGARDAPGAVPARGKVTGVVGTRAFVRLADGSMATVAEELTVPGLALASVLATGQRVEGVHDPESRRLDVRGQLPDTARSHGLVTSGYRPGDVVLVRVAAVETDAVTVELLPAQRCRVPRERVTGNDLDSLADLFSVGEVVLARAAPTPAGIGVRLDDVDDAVETPVPALALLPGGPPWLEPVPDVVPSVPAPASPHVVAEAVPSVPVETAPPAAPEPATSTSTPEPAPAARPAAPSPALFAARAGGTHAPMPAPRPARTAGAVPDAEVPERPERKGTALASTQLALDAERSRADAAERTALDARVRARSLEVEVAQLRGLVQELGARIDRRDRQIAEQKTRYRTADKRRQIVTRQGEDRAADDGPWFTDPEEQLRYEVHGTWVRLVPAGEKTKRPLASYAVGPRFLESLTLEGVSRRKVLETVVHVLTGRAPDIPGLQLHRLRASSGGGSPQAVRDDGATCFRLSLQVNTSSARRLHFWKLPDGTVELSRVVLHDDVEP